MTVKNRKNKIFLIFIILFVGGYFLFFTSNLWYPDSGKMVKETPIFSPKEWNHRNITLLSWDYSETQQMMEIQLEINNTALDGIDKYTYTALERNSGYLNVVPIMETADYVVLHINNLKKNWREVSLRIGIPEENSKKVETKNELKLYTNKDSVHTVSSISNRTENEYQTDRINSRITMYQNKIYSLNNSIDALETEKLAHERDISALKDKSKYQTDQQKEESAQILSAAESSIQNLKIEIEKYEAEILEYTQRIQKAKEELTVYLK